MDIDPVKNPQFFTNESHASTVIAVATTLMTVTVLVVGLRFYIRHFVLHHLGADDWLALCAAFFAIATGCTQCYMTRQGHGRHIGTLPLPDGFKNYMQNFFISIIFYNTAILFVKMAFLMQYYRVLAVRKTKRLYIIVMIIVGAWALSQILLTMFSCIPIAGYWDSSLNAVCIKMETEWYQNAAGNIITDVIIFLLPLPALAQLKLPKGQKLVLVGIFSLGFFTCAISVIRIQYLHLETDITWENVPPSLWSLAELCSGTICCCLPTLRPLASRFLPGQLSWTGNSGRGYRADYQMYPDSSVRRGQLGSNIERGQTSPIATNKELGYELGYPRAKSSADTVTSGSIMGLDQTIVDMDDSDRGSDVLIQSPPPTRIKFGSDWTRSTIATQIKTSHSPRSNSDSCQEDEYVIRVQKDIVIETT